MEANKFNPFQNNSTKEEKIDLRFKQQVLRDTKPDFYLSISIFRSGSFEVGKPNEGTKEKKAGETLVTFAANGKVIQCVRARKQKKQKKRERKRKAIHTHIH